MESTKKKLAIVTGAARGIGLATAKLFSLNDYKVAIVDRDKNELSNLSLANNSMKSFCYDISDFNNVDMMYQEILEWHDRVDVLVNNAGITKDNIFLRMSDQEWEDVLNINLNSTFNILKLITKGMVKRKYGRIINISSVVGATGGAGQVNYAASKAGLIGLTKSLSQELATRNITVNCIAPGFIETPMTEKLDDNRKDIIISSIPANRIGTPKDLSSAVIFLASQESSYITGQTIHINGGLYMN